MNESNGKTTRRKFLRYFLMGSWVALGLEAASALVAFLRPRRVSGFGSKIAVGEVEDFPVGSITRFREGRFYISHVPEGLLALYWRCTHLGCTVPWVPDQPTEDELAPKGRFNCPCHSSIFDRYGRVHSGPAPRPLDLMEIEIVEGSKVVVNTGKIRQRGDWHPDQPVKVPSKEGR
ncbi:MAG: ubiquinol-cytochrome c reductase iron-sulfur subunit [Thermoplasmata archaeon]|nr:ubiquinol-cytochrome c reductase iron-sulfur subunit [Thermoplasmata archaeon]NIY05153.1 Rieske 2Fe-2S domain-containing protein [Thermoplasmata archaeon]